MGYTAYNVMRAKNLERWGIDGPVEPEMFDKIRLWKKDENGRRKEKPDFDDISDLEKKAISFIREDCENLRFDHSEKRAKLDDFDGTSLKEGQIPYNFQMDIDRRCLEVAIHRFLESGVAKDAFDVYFCYLEMFIGSYRKTKKMIEMLSEFEANASSLLMKHRDHYSHSVYVFLIGLAFYHESDSFREAYKNTYGSLMEKEGLDKNNKNDLAAHFLKFWGMTSLFHDVGYPFELSFEQVKSYFGDTIDYVPFATFNMNNFQNSKVGEIKEKAIALKENCAVQFAMLSSEQVAGKSELDALKKIDKKIAALVKEVYGEASEEYKNRIRLVNGENAEVLLAKQYHEAIIYLDKFVKEIEQVKQEGIEKLQKLSLGTERNAGLENFNAFLANALYEELGEAYAYYGEDKARKFDVFEEYTKRQDNQYAYRYQDYLYDVLCVKPEHPEAFGGYIDHAYFSTIILLNTLIQVVEKDSLNEMYTHALTAILLHNSLYKFSITNYKKNAFNDGKHFSLQKHPLAYLLMLCDELQCWDRTSYGQNSRGEVHPFDCELTFEGNKINATYIFDDKYSEDGKLKAEYAKVKGTYKKLCAKDNEKADFLDDIENIISINGDNSFGENNGIKLVVDKAFKPNNRYRNSQLSTSNFIHMYKFAILVHKMNHLEAGQLLDKSRMEQMEDDFEKLSLEYKINHISRTKKFSKILSKVGCFYSDKPMDCEVVTEFGSELNETMGPIEHERWCWEHWVLGWRYIPQSEWEDVKKKYLEDAAIIRECTKRHYAMFRVEGKYEKQAGLVHFQELSESNKEKDTRSICNLLKVLAREDGVKVYRLREDK
ncbi:MAG: hypothetical protein IJX63_10100 [Lachnospiraceae bacterium]|nr:hypothetical protein [Lachnospiraceae bacterium]